MHENLTSVTFGFAHSFAIGPRPDARTSKPATTTMGCVWFHSVEICVHQSGTKTFTPLKTVTRWCGVCAWRWQNLHIHGAGHGVRACVRACVRVAAAAVLAWPGRCEDGVTQGPKTD